MWIKYSSLLFLIIFDLDSLIAKVLKLQRELLLNCLQWFIYFIINSMRNSLVGLGGPLGRVES
jgi:hypothetical protein